MPGPLLIAHPARQVPDTVDVVEHDGSGADGRADEVVVAAEGDEQLGEPLEVEQTLVTGGDWHVRTIPFAGVRIGSLASLAK